MSISVHCFRTDLLYTDVASFVSAVYPTLFPATGGAKTLVFRTRAELDAALSAPGDMHDTALISCSLASYPYEVRDTQAWLHTLLHSESVSFLALAVASESKGNAGFVIVATASIG